MAKELSAQQQYLLHMVKPLMANCPSVEDPLRLHLVRRECLLHADVM